NGIQFKSGFLVAGNDSQNGAKVGDERAGAGEFPDDGYPLEELRTLGLAIKRGELFQPFAVVSQDGSLVTGHSSNSRLKYLARSCWKLSKQLMRAPCAKKASHNRGLAKLQNERSSV